MNAKQLAYFSQIAAVVANKGGRVISDRYVKMVDKMIFQCENGHQWDTEARSILKGMWCRYCHGNPREQGEVNFRKRVAEKGGTVIGPYMGNVNKILIQCHLGHQWEAFPYNITVGKWCNVCGYTNHRGGGEQMFKIVEERKGKVLGNYVNARTRLQVQCDKGHIWEPKPYYIVVGSWCPFCTGSHGENIIATYLSGRNIIYKSQTTIPGLPRKRYDFIIEYKGRKVVIEYDGEMHFKFIPYYHVNEKFFHHRQSVDKVKTLHAFNNNYQVIRIDYSQVSNIAIHLNYALELDVPLCVSTPFLYRDWLIGKTVTNEEMTAVYNGCSRPDYVPIDEISNMFTGLSV